MAAAINQALIVILAVVALVVATAHRVMFGSDRAVTTLAAIVAASTLGVLVL